MNILHTSDWHLGKHLEGRERIPEQREVINEICKLVEERDIHLVLIAGDMFDTFVPPAAAEELFYETIERLSAKGKRAVLIIAGNHDSPERLCASKPLADRSGIILLGMPCSQASITQVPGLGVKVIQSGAGWLEIAVDGVKEHAVVITLSYPSEARLEEVLTSSLDEEEMRQAYSEKVGRLFSELSGHFREDTVNLAMSHLFILGGQSSESERPIQLGGAPTVEPDKLPAKAQYVALGHLHKPQKVGGAPVPAYYSGSPLAYSFSEAGYKKAVYLVQVQPGEEARVEKIELQSGRPLVKWKAERGLDEALQWCESEKDRGAWIELEVYVESPLTQEQIRSLRSLREEIINIRPVLIHTEEKAAFEENRLSKPLKDLFQDFYIYKNGVLPKEELTQFFMEVAMLDQEEPVTEGMKLPKCIPQTAPGTGTETQGTEVMADETAQAYHRRAPQL